MCRLQNKGLESVTEKCDRQTDRQRQTDRRPTKYQTLTVKDALCKGLLTPH